MSDDWSGRAGMLEMALHRHVLTYIVEKRKTVPVEGVEGN